ncbi:MAG: hypothetical protein KBC42_00615 [Candidatus Pacebacteria bacterium]|jgi:hypothetical protein|nr:hypothetical protein [Candidatus Paceibacterota bacterium]MBP9780410.1 hypothetical protein [Candidatus Paceibacterota bacterium]
MIEILTTFAFFALFVILAIKLLNGRVQIQTAQSLEVIDELHKPLQILWLKSNFFSEFQQSALRRIAKKDSVQIERMITLDQKLEMFFKYKNSKAVNQNKAIYMETIGLISKSVLAGIIDSMSKENFTETVELYNRIEQSGKVYPPTKEMYNKIQNFFELTHHDFNSQTIYKQFRLKYRN